MPLPDPVPGKFTTGVCECCAEPLGFGHCLYTCFCFGCAMGDMAEKMHKGEVMKSPGGPPDPWTGSCKCIDDPWTRACCTAGWYTIGPNGLSATTFTRFALRMMKVMYGIEVDNCSYCIMSSCCCCNLCVQVCVRRAARPAGFT